MRGARVQAEMEKAKSGKCAIKCLMSVDFPEPEGAVMMMILFMLISDNATQKN
jgi:hypothetical protein